jgi:hypothetical protein
VFSLFMKIKLVLTELDCIFFQYWLHQHQQIFLHHICLILDPLRLQLPLIRSVSLTILAPHFVLFTATVLLVSNLSIPTAGLTIRPHIFFFLLPLYYWSQICQSPTAGLQSVQIWLICQNSFWKNNWKSKFEFRSVCFFINRKNLNKRVFLEWFWRVQI